MRTILASVVVLCVLASIPAHAQTELGSLRGYVRDQQGGVLPGVTVTATGPELIAPVVAVTDSVGYYRMINLPPGTVTLTAELAGFATYRREGILMRAGRTFTVDIEMEVGVVEETVTVIAETPMIETLEARTSFAVSGELLRAVPVTSRQIYTDAMDMIPGIGSRQANDGSGIRIYYFLGSSQLSSHHALEGAQFGGYANFAPARTSMSNETVGDVELRTGGPEASTPLTTGVYMNIVAPQGGSAFKGSATFTFQPLAWNADNSSGGRVSGGTAKEEGIRQLDLSAGGPIVRDKVWFFSSFRWADDYNGISKTPQDLALLERFRPGFESFNNTWRTKNPFIKVTTQLNLSHQLSAYYVYDRQYYTSHREFDTDKIIFQSGGGSMVQAKLNSAFGANLTSQISVAYSNKSNASEKTYEDLKGTGPQVSVHNDIFLSGGIPRGTGQLVRMNNTQNMAIVPSSLVLLRGDVTYYTEGWGGSHEFKTGVYAMPRSRHDIIDRYVNGGLVLEEVRQIDPNDPAAGLTWFHRRYITPSEVHTTAIRDKDIGIYFQDSWRPVPRITVNAGVRADWVRRYDDIRDFQRMKSVEVGPRLGVTAQVTKDARTVLRFFAGRIHEQVSGSDVVGTVATSAPITTRDVYLDKNGRETTIITPPATQPQVALLFDPDLHQPFVDEFIVGFRKQLPGEVSLDISGRRRVFKDIYGLVDINGIYPSEPYQPFGGFGLVDPNRGIMYQQRNNTWSRTIVNALEVVVAKNMSHNFQAMLSMARQWQHLDGTWNPTDPARFIQPDAFPNNRLLPGTSGNGDHNTLNAASSAFAAYRPYSVRAVGQYLAPWDIILAGSFEMDAGDYTAPIFTRLSASDLRFGPSRVTLANGTTQSNPLATTIRFAFPTRGEGQVLNENVNTVQLKIGKTFRSGTHEYGAMLNIYNLLNSGSNTQYAEGANVLYDPRYLSAANRIPARAFQLLVTYRF